MVLAWLWSVGWLLSAAMAPADLNWKGRKLWRDSMKKTKPKQNQKVQNISLVHNINRKNICAKELGLWEMEVKNCLLFFMCQPYNSLTSSNPAFWNQDQIRAKLLNFHDFRAQLTPMRSVQMRQVQDTVTTAAGNPSWEIQIFGGAAWAKLHTPLLNSGWGSSFRLHPFTSCPWKAEVRHTGWEIDWLTSQLGSKA